MAVYKRGSIGLFFRGDPTLKAWWTLNERATDYSGNGKHGTIVGSVPFVPEQKFNTSAYFSGSTSNYIDCGSPIIGNNSAFTILAWARWIIGNDPYPSIYCEGNTGNSAPTIELYFHDANRCVGFYYRDDANVNGTATSPNNSVNPNLLNFVALVSESKSLRKIYLNGQYQGQDTTSMGTLTLNTSTLGVFKRIGIGNPMTGNIVEVAIFSRALSSQEISAYYRWATQTQWKTKYAPFSFTTAIQSIALQSLLEKRTYSTTALQSLLEAYNYNTTALFTDLQRFGIDTTALQSLLEKTSQNTTALQSQLDKALRDTLAMTTTLRAKIWRREPYRDNQSWTKEPTH